MGSDATSHSRGRADPPTRGGKGACKVSSCVRREMLSASISFMSTNFPERILSTNFLGSTSPAGDSNRPASGAAATLVGDARMAETTGGRGGEE